MTVLLIVLACIAGWIVAGTGLAVVFGRILRVVDRSEWPTLAGEFPDGADIAMIVVFCYVMPLLGALCVLVAALSYAFSKTVKRWI